MEKQLTEISRGGHQNRVSRFLIFVVMTAICRSFFKLSMRSWNPIPFSCCSSSIMRSMNCGMEKGSRRRSRDWNTRIRNCLIERLPIDVDRAGQASSMALRTGGTWLSACRRMSVELVADRSFLGIHGKMVSCRSCRTKIWVRRDFGL